MSKSAICDIAKVKIRDLRYKESLLQHLCYIFDIFYLAEIQCPISKKVEYNNTTNRIRGNNC